MTGEWAITKLPNEAEWLSQAVTRWCFEYTDGLGAHRYYYHEVSHYHALRDRSVALEQLLRAAGRAAAAVGDTSGQLEALVNKDLRLETLEGFVRPTTKDV